MKIRILLIVCLFSMTSHANNLLVQNVTSLNNDAVNKTIQVQFDISWDNSWRDSINYDAAWIFIKFKNASGVWQHAQLNQTGFNLGTGTADSVKVTSDKVGTWVYRSGLGSGTFNVTGMQLQWNYGLSGLTSVSGLEVRVYAVEMVYVPEGDFNCVNGNPNAGVVHRSSFRYGQFDSNGFYQTSAEGYFYAPGYNFPVINTKLTPALTYNDSIVSYLRIKGDLGVDFNNDGIVENLTYPTGYRAFFCYKYEMTEQQYADFLNTLTATQRTTLGVAGTGITITGGQYFSSTPNKACNNANTQRLYAYADWSGIRPMSFLEFNKASYGPIQPVYNYNYGYSAWGSSNSGPSSFSYVATNVGYAAGSTTTRAIAGASYFGILELTGSALEPIVKLNYLNFNGTNGNGVLLSTGLTDITSWNSSSMIMFIDQHSVNNYSSYNSPNNGFRYVRSAE